MMSYHIKKMLRGAFLIASVAIINTAFAVQPYTEQNIIKTISLAGPMMGADSIRQMMIVMLLAMAGAVGVYALYNALRQE